MELIAILLYSSGTFLTGMRSFCSDNGEGSSSGNGKGSSSKDSNKDSSKDSDEDSDNSVIEKKN